MASPIEEEELLRAQKRKEAFKQVQEHMEQLDTEAKAEKTGDLSGKKVKNIASQDAATAVGALFKSAVQQKKN